MPEFSIPKKLLPFMQTKKRIKVCYGGRGGGKSETIAKILLMRAQTEGIKILCLRELQNSIEDSVHSLLATGIEEMGLEGFEITQQAIRYNGEDAFKFRGMARNPDAIKSLHNFNVAWVEESSVCSEKSLKMLTPTLRTKDSEIWFSMNPGSSADPMSQRYLKPFEKQLLRDGHYEDDQHLIIKVNYDDNRFFPEVLEKERQWDERNLPRSMYDHIWLGAYQDDIEGSLISAEHFDACIDAHIKLGFEPTGAKYAAHDPSDLGPDAKAYVMRHGSVVLDVREMTTGTLQDGARWSTDLAIKQGVDHYTYDADGMGVGIREQVANAFQGKSIQVAEFRGSESPDTPNAVYYSTEKHVIAGSTKVKDALRNKRAQYYMALRDRIYRTYLAVEKGEYHDPDTLLSFDSSIPELAGLRSEVCRIPVKPNGTGKLELYRKDEAKRLFHLASPNMSDGLMMVLRTPPAIIRPTVMPRTMKTMGGNRRST